eukprot:1283171-Amphidinium_carterae.2
MSTKSPGCKFLVTSSRCLCASCCCICVGVLGGWSALPDVVVLWPLMLSSCLGIGVLLRLRSRCVSGGAADASPLSVLGAVAAIAVSVVCGRERCAVGLDLALPVAFCALRKGLECCKWPVPGNLEYDQSRFDRDRHIERERPLRCGMPEYYLVQCAVVVCLQELCHCAICACLQVVVHDEACIVVRRVCVVDNGSFGASRKVDFPAQMFWGVVVVVGIPVHESFQSWAIAGDWGRRVLLLFATGSGRRW